jgi:Family of unknown function (DUF6263)
VLRSAAPSKPGHRHDVTDGDRYREFGKSAGGLEGVFRMSQGWRFVLICGVSVFILAASSGVAPATDEAPSTTERAGESGAKAAEKHKLTFKFQVGQIVRQEIAHESEIKTHKNQDTETARNSSKSRRHYRVVAVDERSGEADLELTIDWVHMTASFEGADGKKTKPIEFQSNDPEKHPEQFGNILASVGRSCATIRFNRTGAPVKVVSGRVPQTATAPIGESKATTGSPLTDGSLEAYLIPLPDQPVAVGEEWRDKFDVIVRDDVKNLTKITIQRVYKLLEVKEGRAVIELRTAILTPVNNGAIAAQLIQREITGKIVFDIERGLIISRETVVDNTVVNAVGANSVMRALSRYHEKLAGVDVIADRKAEDGVTSKK